MINIMECLSFITRTVEKIQSNFIDGESLQEYYEPTEGNIMPIVYNLNDQSIVLLSQIIDIAETIKNTIEGKK